MLKSQQRFKNEAHNMYTEEINMIALRSNDDKRLQTFDRITSYPYGTSAGKRLIMKIPNKRELQQIALNHSSDNDFKDFMKIYKKCTAELYSFLVIDTTLPSDNHL